MKFVQRIADSKFKWSLTEDIVDENRVEMILQPPIMTIKYHIASFVFTTRVKDFLYLKHCEDNKNKSILSVASEQRCANLCGTTEQMQSGKDQVKIPVMGGVEHVR
ncbi:hypothetical protein CEXT_371511 [Caerostris extrusa]|uniref:Uncharacterized protein n=1 Tax=Caerostris extrusa TaxID=172846 RepID=A0AAV4VRR7_CAEEX|nr:hypothetical protein CEXT_371511 [Caerostris extrusa]